MFKVIVFALCWLVFKALVGLSIFPRFLTENISLIDASLIGSMAVLMHNQFHRDFTNLADNPCLLLLSGCRQLSYCEYCMDKFS